MDEHSHAEVAAETLLDHAVTGLDAFRDGWELYSDGVVAGVVMGVVLGMLGVYIVLRRLVFLSAALGQASSLGVVVALFFGASLSGEREVAAPVLGALAFGFGAAMLVSSRRRRSSVQRDGLLGALYLAGAAGTLLLGSRMAHEMHEIEALLHGVGVAVMPEDLELVLAMAGIVLLLQISAWRAFAAVAFDPVGAAVRRVPTNLVEIAMAFSIAAAFAVGIRALGALPVFALSVVPALAAIRLARTLPWALAIGAWLGAVAGWNGYLFAFVLDAPVGASQALAALAVTGGVALALWAGRGWRGAAAGSHWRIQQWVGVVLVACALVMPLLAGREMVLQVVAGAAGAAMVVAFAFGVGRRTMMGTAAVALGMWLAFGPSGPGVPEVVRGLVAAIPVLAAAEHVRGLGRS